MEADPNHLRETFSSADTLKIHESCSVKAVLMLTFMVLSTVSSNQLNVFKSYYFPASCHCKSHKCMRGLLLILSYHCKVFWLPQVVIFSYHADGPLHAHKINDPQIVP